MDNKKDSELLKANFTAVISDMHLCEAEPVHPTIPLWKKFKTKEFFFDDQVVDFIDHIVKKADTKALELNCNNSLELILNGDIFDFDSVTKLPEAPAYKMTWLEKKRGLFPEEAKSCFKIRCIIEDHPTLISALSNFVKKGKHLVFIVGNHDLEILFPRVQQIILNSLKLSEEEIKRVRFCPWFYISNGDTLIEHGHQYDPYCVCQNPIHPLIRVFNRVELRIPFGNIACRYMINGMGFFNPHVDSNYIMSIPEYINFFLKYMARAQPFLLLTYFWSACATFVKAFTDWLLPAMKDPLTTESRIEEIALISNATPRMVRELNELKVHPAASNPIKIGRELWLDRSFILICVFWLVFQFFALIKLNFDISFFWMFIPMALFIPFFLFYSRSIKTSVHEYKEPQERILNLSGYITRVKRVIYGHTHVIKHEQIGGIEHLNPGTWSPAFLDIECTMPLAQRVFVWIEPTIEKERIANCFEFRQKEEKLMVF